MTREMLPESVIAAVTAAGLRFLVGPNDFDECLLEVAGRIADALEQQNAPHSRLYALRGVAAGVAIGKYIERQRRKIGAEA